MRSRHDSNAYSNIFDYAGYVPNSPDMPALRITGLQVWRPQTFKTVIFSFRLVVAILNA